MNATKVNEGLAESNGRLLLGIWRDSLHVTCGLTACTPGSAPGPTLGNEYGKTLPFLTFLLNYVYCFDLKFDMRPAVQFHCVFTSQEMIFHMNILMLLTLPTEIV